MTIRRSHENANKLSFAYRAIFKRYSYLDFCFEQTVLTVKRNKYVSKSYIVLPAGPYTTSIYMISPASEFVKLHGIKFMRNHFMPFQKYANEHFRHIEELPF